MLSYVREMICGGTVYLRFHVMRVKSTNPMGIRL